MLKIRERIQPSASSAAGSNGQGRHYAKDALRIGMCGIGRAGFGMFGKELQARPEVRVVAGFDLLHERAAQLSSLSGSKIYSRYEDLLNDSHVELVVVATRSHEHVPMSLLALQAGKHVLVEKPPALTLKGFDTLAAAARRHKRQLFVRHNRRFDPPMLHAQEIIKSGKLGRVFSIQLRVGGYQRRSDWQTLRSYGGGQLLNWGPHLVNWGMQLMGCHAKSVWSDLKLIAAAGDAEDHVKILIRGENDMVVDIEISGAAAITQPAWLILGKQGALQIDGDICKLRYFDPKKVTRIKASAGTPVGKAGAHFTGGSDIPWIEEEFEVAPKKTWSFWLELYRTIRRGTKFPVTLDQVRENMRVIEMARKGSDFAIISGL